MPTSLVGADIRRVEDPRALTGRSSYVGDIQLPGMLHLALLRSPHPKARILRLDASRARRAPGVALVYTGQDLRGLPKMPTNRAVPNVTAPDQPVLAVDSVFFVGSPVAVVVAETRARAEDAVELLDVNYEILPSVSNVEEAQRPGAPLVHDELGTNISYRITRRAGDPDAAFAAAHKVASVRIRVPRLSASALEPRGVVASYDQYADTMTLWISTQAPGRARSTIAELVGLPESRVRVIAPDVGGAFGSKFATYREDVLCALTARQLGRPVRWIADRMEDLQATQHSRDTIADLEAAIDDRFRVTAIRLRLIANMGAFLNPSTPRPPILTTMMAVGAYQVEHFSGETIGVLTNTMATGAYRGSGRPDGVLFVERLMDEVAHVCGIDPVEARRRNFIRVDQMPYKTATGARYDSGDYAATMDHALAIADYEGLRRMQAEARARDELVGIGVSTFVEPSGGTLQESGLLRVEPAGTVSAFTGSSPHGQGHETAFAQILADTLQVPFGWISVRHGDTDSGPPGTGTFGSRSVQTGGSALLVAAGRLIEKAKRIAAHLLEALPEDLVLQDGKFTVAGAPDRTVTWTRVAATVHGQSGALPPGEEIGLEETVYWKAEQPAWSHGTYIAVVRIDRESGGVNLERLVAVDDCGTIVNPLLVEGQVRGGIVQGIGQAFLERVAFDERGHLLSGTLVDYLIPGFDAVPSLVLDHTISPSPLNPLGAKGVGEAGAIGAPAAIYNAVADALRPWRVGELSFPFAPHRVWQALSSDLPR